MTDALKQAAQQALEALERIDTLRHVDIVEVHLALRAALDQPAAVAPEPEPKLPEFFAQLDYDKNFNVLVSVYQRRPDATPVLVHQEPMKAQEAAPAPDNLACKSVRKRLAIQRGDAVQEPERVPPGHVVVPEKPTFGMVRAGENCDESSLEEHGENAPVADVYRAMLAAAPSTTSKEPT